MTAVEIKTTSSYVEYNTGLSFEIPEGYVGLVFSRSSVSNKNLDLANSVGVIDSGYRGPVKLRFRTTFTGLAKPEYFYEVGDRVGQILIVPCPKIDLVESESLTSSERGVGGFGSSGS